MKNRLNLMMYYIFSLTNIFLIYYIKCFLRFRGQINNFIKMSHVMETMDGITYTL